MKLQHSLIRRGKKMNVKIIAEKPDKQLFGYKQTVYVVDLDSVQPDKIPFVALCSLIGDAVREPLKNLKTNDFKWTNFSVLKSNSVSWFKNGYSMTIKSRKPLSFDDVEKVINSRKEELRFNEGCIKPLSTIKWGK